MWFSLRKRKQTKTNLEPNPINVILDEEKELLGDPEDARWLVPREEPAVPLVPEIQNKICFCVKILSSFV